MLFKNWKIKIERENPQSNEQEDLRYIKNIHTLNTEKALKSIREMKNELLKHCGPYGKYALINNPYNPMTEPVFTKDGFNIFKQMYIDDPVAKIFHKMVLYIGKKIAIHIGDGTTTGMLITLNLIEEFLIQMLQDIENQTFEMSIRDIILGNTFSELKNFSEYITNIIKTKIEENKITIDSLVEQAYNTDVMPVEDSELRNYFIKLVAYAQAYTSSHGDKEIAQIVSDMFNELPEETLTSLRFVQSGHETKDRLSLLVEPFQYSCRSDILSAGMLNVEQKSRFYTEGATLALLNQTLVSESHLTTELVEKIKHHYAENKPLVILTTGACGVTRNRFHSLFLELKTQYKDKPNPPIAILFTPITEPIINDIFIISLIGGIYAPSEQFVEYLEDITVEFEKGELRLSNLYEGCSEIHPNLRPMYRNSSYSTYNDILSDIDKRIEKYKELGSSKNSIMNNDLNEMIRLKNNLLLNKRISIVIGGSGYDNVALFDIVEDCINAVRKSITKGFVPGGLFSIYSTLCENENDIIKESEEVETIFKWYKSAILKTLDSMFEEDIINNIENDGYCYDVISGDWTDVSNILTWAKIESLQDDFHPVIQPADTDLTMFKRIEEVILKIIYTDNFFQISEGIQV